jgi:hypothetical protein
MHAEKSTMKNLFLYSSTVPGHYPFKVIGGPALEILSRPTDRHMMKVTAAAIRLKWMSIFTLRRGKRKKSGFSPGCSMQDG